MSRLARRGARTLLPRARALALPALLVPALVSAQRTTALGPFAAYPLGAGSTDAPSGLLVGLQGTLSSGVLGLRVGAGTALRGGGTGEVVDPAEQHTVRATGWMADGDVLLLPQALGGRRSAGTPMFYGLAGLGASSSGDGTSGTRGTAPTTTWSYGAGVLVPLGTLELSAESRTRTPLTSGRSSVSQGGAWHEVRVGLGLRFGGASRGRETGRSRPTSRDDVRFPAPSGRAPSGRGTAASASAARVLASGDRYLGTPYKWGGTSPSGFDCSGFVQYVYARNGVELPRTSRQQAQVGLELATSWSAVAPGDLVMFAEPGEAISHVAIYAGGRRILHSSSSGGGVRYDDLDTQRGQWYVQRMVAARRVTSDGGSLVRALVGAFGPVVFDAPDRAPRPR